MDQLIDGAAMPPESVQQTDFSRDQMAVVIALGIIAGVIPALQPILLGGLHAAGQLTAEQIGRAGMLEGLGMLLGSCMATLFLPPRRLRPVSIAALAVMMVANGATAFAHGDIVLLLRALSGGAAGLCLWVLVGMLTRARDGARLFAIYVTAQAIVATLLSWLLSLLVVPDFGIAAGYWLIAVLSLLLLGPAALFVPCDYASLANGRVLLPTAAGFAGLAAILCFLAGILALWVYFVPIAAELGHDSRTAGLIVSSAIAVQIVGGMGAIRVAGRWSGAYVTTFSALGAALAIAVLLFLGAHFAMLVLATCLIGFFWMFAPPSHLPFLLQVDPAGRSAAFISVAQLGGLSVGPLFASIAVDRGGSAAAGWAALTLLLASAVIGLAVTRISRR